MSEELAIAYQRMQALGVSAMRMLPNIVIAVVVLLLILLGVMLAVTIAFPSFTPGNLISAAYPTRRLQYDVVVGYGDDIPTVKTIMLEALRTVPGVETDPAPDPLLMDYAESGVAVRIRWWIKPPRKAEVVTMQDKVLETVKAALSKHGIDLPYPTRQVLFHDQTEETDGDRRRQREGWPAGEGEVPRPVRTLASDAGKA
jgi:hypothetical protein